jgi:hypothetical protein
VTSPLTDSCRIDDDGAKIDSALVDLVAELGW